MLMEKQFELDATIALSQTQHYFPLKLSEIADRSIYEYVYTWVFLEIEIEIEIMIDVSYV